MQFSIPSNTHVLHTAERLKKSRTMYMKKDKKLTFQNILNENPGKSTKPICFAINKTTMPVVICKEKND